jgi:HAE1 family hydrophobic/amphiphilic exporter-1
MQTSVPQRVAATLRETTFNISQWSIDHPYPVIAFYVGVVIMAILAVGAFMPRRMMPYVESPMIGVVSMMPGL